MRNGSRLLPTMDGRSVWGRILRDTLAELTNHCGGASLMSETRRLAARRTAILECELCFLEDRFAKLRADGDEPDVVAVETYARIANQQRRLAEVLGWERTQRDVTTSIEQFTADIMAGKATEPQP